MNIYKSCQKVYTILALKYHPDKGGSEQTFIWLKEIRDKEIHDSESKKSIINI